MDPFLLFMFHVCLCYTVLSVPCSVLINCWEKGADLLALLYVVFSCVLFLLLYGVSSQVWYFLSLPSSLLYLMISNKYIAMRYIKYRTNIKPFKQARHYGRASE